MFINAIANKDRSIMFQYKRLISNLKKNDLKLYEFVNEYFYQYCKFNKVSVDNVIKIRKKFANNYIYNLKRFEKFSFYPKKKNKFSLSRVEYDVVLLLSFLIEKHRFEIIKLFVKEKYKGKILIIGSGPSLELALLKFFLNIKNKIEAYDTSFNSFVKKKFKKEYKKKKYVQNHKKYDVIVLIEFLEHLTKPYEFLFKLKKSLFRNGKVILTTAINIPQFDHLYNFKKNEIIKKVKKMGFKKRKIKYIEHKMFISNVKSANEYLVLNT